MSRRKPHSYENDERLHRVLYGLAACVWIAVCIVLTVTILWLVVAGIQAVR